MFDISSWVTAFHQAHNQYSNQSASMTVFPTQALPAWQCVCTWQMTISEMKARGVEGQSNCYVIALDEQGEPLRASDLALYYIRHGWEGMRPDEVTDPAPFEKQWPEPPGNIPLFHGATYWLEIGAKNNDVMSDRVYGITATNPSDSDPNGHHVSVVVFQRRGLAETEPQDSGDVVVKRADLLQIRALTEKYLGG